VTPSSIVIRKRKVNNAFFLDARDSEGWVKRALPEVRGEKIYKAREHIGRETQKKTGRKKVLSPRGY